MAHNFGPACRDEATVFGASRPGYNGKNVSPAEVQEWIQFMQSMGIERVVCLLGEKQLAHYRPGLLETYQQTFGEDNVLSAPVEDYHLSSLENLKRVMAFLGDSTECGEKVVVHCSGGSGRTGHVLAAWLIHARGLENDSAIEAVMSSGASRNPREAVHSGNATPEQLNTLLWGVCQARGERRG